MLSSDVWTGIPNFLKKCRKNVTGQLARHVGPRRGIGSAAAWREHQHRFETRGRVGGCGTPPDRPRIENRRIVDELCPRTGRHRKARSNSGEMDFDWPPHHPISNRKRRAALLSIAAVFGPGRGVKLAENSAVGHLDLMIGDEVFYMVGTKIGAFRAGMSAASILPSEVKKLRQALVIHT